uniref:DUF674 family protein n=1 Tax=Lactuca sativa TaxID=4236 RepID=A0A9R1UD76_LACSA|nr:hypothetical protein LSAT_V11C900469160 [Lactuca sativa]
MGNVAEKSANSVQLKVFIDEKKKKVMFAEADEDFVEILFSFLTLPLGTIASLNSKDIKVGSLTSLYESVQNLNKKLFFKYWYKDCLLNPMNSSANVCEKLKVNLNGTKSIPYQPDAILFKKKGRFVITDDLNILPLVMDTSIALLNSLGVESIDLLHEKTIYFGLKEFSHLLKWSLLTNNPLTNLVFGGRKSCSSLSTYSTPCNYSPFMSGNFTQTTVKLLLQKSKKKVLCAQVENRFVELLFSFLTIPLGAYELLTKDIYSSPILGISNLYNSISSLGERKFLKSEDVKSMLLCPKLATNYLCVTDLFPIYEDNIRPGRFLKEQATFIVSDDLKVTASQSIATISNFNAPGVPIPDMEFLDLYIGEEEALLLLKVSLMSTSALTDWLRVLQYRKKPKVKSSLESLLQFILGKIHLLWLLIMIVFCLRVMCQNLLSLKMGKRFRRS